MAGVTSLYAALFAVFFLVLSARVADRRLTQKPPRAGRFPMSL